MAFVAMRWDIENPKATFVREGATGTRATTTCSYHGFEWRLEMTKRDQTEGCSVGITMVRPERGMPRSVRARSIDCSYRVNEYQDVVVFERVHLFEPGVTLLSKDCIILGEVDIDDRYHDLHVEISFQVENDAERLLPLSAVRDEFTDCKLVCASGPSIACHKLVLARASTVFRAAFGGNMAESKDNELRLHPAVSEAMMRDLVDHIYEGWLPSKPPVQHNIEVPASLDEEEAKKHHRNPFELFCCADLYDLQALCAACTPLIEDHLDGDNIGDIAAYVDNLDKNNKPVYAQLIKVVSDYISENSEVVLSLLGEATRAKRQKNDLGQAVPLSVAMSNANNCKALVVYSGSKRKSLL